MGPGTNFEWQHDARLYGCTLTLFNDADGYCKSREPVARDADLPASEVDDRDARCTPIRTTRRCSPRARATCSCCRTTTCSSASARNPYFTEFSRPGKQLFTGQVRLPGRVLPRLPVPLDRVPDRLAGHRREPTSSGTTVYASWNGATQIATWRVLRVRARARSRPWPQKPFNGFETAIADVEHAALLRRAGARRERPGARHLGGHPPLSASAVAERRPPATIAQHGSEPPGPRAGRPRASPPTARGRSGDGRARAQRASSR